MNKPIRPYRRIAGGEQTVSSLIPVKLGSYSYLFIMHSGSTYETELKSEVLAQLSSFGEDLGLAGLVVHSYPSAVRDVEGELLEKPWPEGVKNLLMFALQPVMLVLDSDFDAFDPSTDKWGMLEFSNFAKDKSVVAHVLHKIALISRNGQDLFGYLDGLHRNARFRRLVKYINVDKVGAFGIFIDAQAILMDIASSG